MLWLLARVTQASSTLVSYLIQEDCALEHLNLSANHLGNVS